MTEYLVPYKGFIEYHRIAESLTKQLIGIDQLWSVSKIEALDDQSRHPTIQ
jgi:hypothetical protein